MAAITASGNTHHDKQLPTTSSSTPELQKQPPPQLTSVLKSNKNKENKEIKVTI